MSENRHRPSRATFLQRCSRLPGQRLKSKFRFLKGIAALLQFYARGLSVTETRTRKKKIGLKLCRTGDWNLRVEPNEGRELPKKPNGILSGRGLVGREGGGEAGVAAVAAVLRCQPKRGSRPACCGRWLCWHLLQRRRESSYRKRCCKSQIGDLHLCACAYAHMYARI